MKTAIIGSTGFVGSSITNELTNRGHQVTGISRNINTPGKENVKYIALDVLDIDKLSGVLKGSDVVISAFNAGWDNPNIYDDFIAGSKAIQEAVKRACVKRYIVIGGAGSLYVSVGVQAADANRGMMPPGIMGGVLAARDYLDILREEKALDWVFFSPPFEMSKEVTTGRTGKYRLGTEFPVFDDKGRSMLSVEDLAVVIADEAEHPIHHRQRFTAAY